MRENPLRGLIAQKSDAHPLAGGPSGRERVVAIIGALHDEGVLHTQAKANALLKAGDMAPLYDGQPIEVALLRALQSESAAAPATAMPAPESRPAAQARTNTNLPAQLSSFIGREREMAEVSRLLATTRLLTLTGSGGAGKTRLAVEVGAALAAAHAADRATASAQAPTCPDGVWMVEFAALSEGRQAPYMVATAFGLQAAGRTSEEVLIEHLCDKRLLVTSREALNVPGEVTWRVPSLAHDEAQALFLERAGGAPGLRHYGPVEQHPRLAHARPCLSGQGAGAWRRTGACVG